MTNARFPSKVDTWLLLVLAFAPLMSLGVGLATLSRGSYVGLMPFLFILAIYGGLVFPMYYELGDDALVIHFGLMKSRVSYRNIRRVTPTNNPISSPALSLDRLHIDAGTAASPNISPKDKSEFLDALARRAPHLKRVGAELIAE